MKKIDVKGLSCPEPVLQTMTAVNEGHNEIEVTVDTSVSKENVSRFLADKGYTVNIVEDGDIIITGKK